MKYCSYRQMETSCGGAALFIIMELDHITLREIKGELVAPLPKHAL